MRARAALRYACDQGVAFGGATRRVAALPQVRHRCCVTRIPPLFIPSPISLFCFRRGWSFLASESVQVWPQYCKKLPSWMGTFLDEKIRDGNDFYNDKSIITSNDHKGKGADCAHEICTDDSSLDEQELNDADLIGMVAAVRVLLQGLGEDLHRDGLLKTPLRVARAFLLAMKGYQMSAEDIICGALFCEPGPQDPNASGGGSGGMVIVRNIDLFATCRACLLPFKIRSHVAYIPSGERVVGLSKLPRVAEIYSNRLQTPHEYADGVAQALFDTFKPLGVAVVVESWHLQWPDITNGNGITKPSFEDHVAWIPLQAYAGKGSFTDKSSTLWDEFLAVLELEGTHIHFSSLRESHVEERRGGSCPFLSRDWKTLWNGCNSALFPTICNGLGTWSPSNGMLKNAPENLVKAEIGSIPAMVVAVESLLRAVGQDPSSQELEFTAMRYVCWLLASTQGSRYPSSYLPQRCINSNSVTVNSLAVADADDQMEMIMAYELHIPFYSQCEHHLLPFSGIAHVGYFYSIKDSQIERSMVLKIVQSYSRRLQVQERLTRQIAEAILSSSTFGGVMVVVDACHVCMVSRGVKKIASNTATVATIGRFAKDVVSRTAFLKTILKGKAGISRQC